MTWSEMHCGAEETERRIAVCVRMNKLWNKRNRAEDKATQKRLDREIDRIRRAEAPWMKDAAYWLY